MSLVEASIKPTIKAVFIGHLLEAYCQKGGDDAALLHSVGMLPIERMASTRISVAQFFELTQALQDALDDEMLGYMTRPVPPGSFEALCRTIPLLPNAGAVIELLNNIYCIFNEGQSLFYIREEDHSDRLYLTPHAGLQSISPYFTQRWLLTAYKLLCCVSNNRVTLTEVGLGTYREEEVDELRFVFGCANIVDNEASYLAFPGRVFSQPIVQSAEGLATFMDNYRLHTLMWSSIGGLESSIRQIIGVDLVHGFPNFATIASSLKISSQTLSRRLLAENTSYQKIKDNMRRDAAISLLANSQLSIKEVAYQVGFKESSSFSKSFKTWTALSPSDYRQSMGR